MPFNWNSRDVVLSGAALALLGVVLVAACFQPWLAVGIPPILWAVAGVITAIRGKAQDDPAKEVETSTTTPEITNKPKSAQAPADASGDSTDDTAT